jgi:enamine deaminase RidA (YjgF/YER057c/UK114 family)
MPVERFASGGVYEDAVGYSRVVVASGYGGVTGWTAGTTSLISGVVQHPGDAHGQAVVAFQAALFALERAGFSRADTVHSRMYVVDLPRNADGVGRAHAAILGQVRPAATMVGVQQLIDPDLLVEVELVAWRPEDDPAA